MRVMSRYVIKGCLLYTSIQFNRDGLCTVSIKNRYNHAVNNPDATYGNDLDRIVPGLTESFATLLRDKYNLILNMTHIDKLNIPDYVVANDGKYYKYNMETVSYTHLDVYKRQT